MTEKDLEIQEMRRELDRVKKHLPKLRESLDELCEHCVELSEFDIDCGICPAAKVKQSISLLGGATIPQKAKNLQRGVSTRGKAEKA